MVFAPIAPSERRPQAAAQWQAQPAVELLQALESLEDADAPSACRACWC